MRCELVRFEFEVTGREAKARRRGEVRKGTVELTAFSFVSSAFFNSLSLRKKADNIKTGRVMYRKKAVGSPVTRLTIQVERNDWSATSWSARGGELGPKWVWNQAGRRRRLSKAWSRRTDM